MMTRFRTGAALAAVVGIIAAAPTAAHAQANDKKKQAKEHYEKGTTHYNLGRFDEAIAEFTAAFELYAEPVFLFNIAQSWRMKENWERARFFYKRYLSLSPNATNRADVEARIAEMEAELRKKPEPPPLPDKPLPDKPLPDKPLPDKPLPDKKQPDIVPDPPEGEPAPFGVVGGVSRESPIFLSVAAGPGFVAFGGVPDPVPVQFSFALNGAYLFTRDKLSLGGGATFGFTPIPYDSTKNIDNTDVGTAGTAGLAGLTFSGLAYYAVANKLDVHLEMGLGVTWFTGLGKGNQFTSNNGAEPASGPVPMFTFRTALGVDYRLADNLTAFVYPVFSRSSLPDNIKETITKIQQIDLFLGIGYSL